MHLEAFPVPDQKDCERWSGCATIVAGGREPGAMLVYCSQKVFGRERMLAQGGSTEIGEPASGASGSPGFGGGVGNRILDRLPSQLNRPSVRIVSPASCNLQ